MECPPSEAQDGAHPLIKYLLIDDEGKLSRVFDQQVSLPGRLEFEVMDDPELLLDFDTEDLAEFDGAIVDFHQPNSPVPAADGAGPV